MNATPISTWAALTPLVLAAGWGLAAAPSSAPSYLTDPGQSRLEFAGTQAGAPFNGVFKKFSVNAAFDPNQPGNSRLDVQIDMNSLDSQDADRDKTMRSAEFFDVAHNASARYTTRTITKTAKGFSAVGSLSLRGVTRDVPIEFTFIAAPGGARLNGDAKLKRLDFGVGQGEWKSTQWVGDEVKVHFSLVLKSVP